MFRVHPFWATSQESDEDRGRVSSILVPPLDVPPQHQQEAGRGPRAQPPCSFSWREHGRLAGEFLGGGREPAGDCRDFVGAWTGIRSLLEFCGGTSRELFGRPSRSPDAWTIAFALLDGRAPNGTAAPPYTALQRSTWSYELLPEPERRLPAPFSRLSPAGFTLEAATAVMSDGGQWPRQPLWQASRNLVAEVAGNLGWVGARRSLADAWRRSAPMRSRKLAESGESHPGAARHHAEFFSRPLLRRLPAGPSLWSVTRHSGAIRRLGPAMPERSTNVRAALDWSFSSVGDAAIGVVLTAAYAPVWLPFGVCWSSGRERTERAPGVSCSRYEPEWRRC